MNDNNDIESIIQELKADEVPAPINIQQTESGAVNDDNVGEYVYKKSSELVESTLSAVQSLKDTVLTGSDPKEIAALSQLINSATKALDQLNKINIQNKVSKSNVEIKKMEIDANANRPVLPNTTNVLIATRDEVMKQLFDKPTKKSSGLDLIEGEFTKEQINFLFSFLHFLYIYQNVQRFCNVYIKKKPTPFRGWVLFDCVSLPLRDS